jgi:hypothetical protein
VSFAEIRVASVWIIATMQAMFEDSSAGLVTSRLERRKMIPLCCVGWLIIWRREDEEALYTV